MKLLGAFSLHGRSERTGPLPKKARALIAFLAMHPDRPFPREQLATLLWGDSENEQARRSLRECLMSVRTALGAAASKLLVTSGSNIQLDARHVESDVHLFETLARSTGLEDLQEAAALYRDEFLCDLQVTSEQFAEWAATERRRLASLRCDVVYRLAVAQARDGRYNDAIATAERLATIDPLREDGHRLLIQLLAAAGQRTAALKQYALCADVLQRELGVAPEKATVELADAVREGLLNGHLQADIDPELTVAAEPRTSSALPNKTSVAVIPFVNLSGTIEQDYFADGIAEELTMMLGRVPWLFVIGSSAAKPYRGDLVDIRGVGSDLGVRYALRGSVRKNGNRVRIVAQLLDTTHGGQVWADRFDGELSDIFAIQEQVAEQTSAKLAPALQSFEIERSQRKTDNLNAYDLYLRALPRFRTTFDDNKEAVTLLERAIALDPLYGSAYGLAARCYQFQRLFGWVVASDLRLQEGVRLARLAAEIGKNDSEALWMAGIALAQLAGELEHGVALIERSLALNPNSASAWISSSFVFGEIGDAATALEHFERAQRLNPLDSMHHVQWLAAGFAYLVAGRYEDAAVAIDRTLSARPSYTPAVRVKVSVCGLLGQRDEGQKWVHHLLTVNSDASVAWFSDFWRLPLRHNPGLYAKLLEGARVAGLPETS